MNVKHFIKEIISIILYKRRMSVLRGERPLVSKKKLISDLYLTGLDKGDVVFLHSSLKKIGFVEGGPKTIIDAFEDVLGCEGTLIVPTFSMKGTMMNTCLDTGYTFDVNHTPTTMGAIPSALLKSKESKRSIHPTHSVAAIGKHASWITESHHLSSSTFGKDSPWGRLVDCGGKLMGLGIDMGPVTFYHLLEDLWGDKFPLPVKIDTKYQIPCLDWDGKSVTVRVQPFDKAYSKQRIDQADRSDLRMFFQNVFSEAGIIKTFKVGQAESWIGQAREFLQFLEDMASQGITIYSGPEQLKSFQKK